MRSLLPPLALALVGASCVSVSVVPRFGPLDVDGRIGVNDASSGLTARNDLDDVGIDRDNTVLGARADLEVGGMHTTLALSDSSHGGSGTLAAELSDGTTTIPAGTDVESDLDLTIGEAMVTWDLVPGDTVEVGIGLGATIFRVDSSFQAPSTGDEIATDETVPIPLLAARVGLAFGDFDVSAVLGGMRLDIDGESNSFYDLDFMARMRIFGQEDVFAGALVLGYRHVDLSAEYEDSGSRVEAHVRIRGPYIGFSFGF
ncbi:MAG: hypothetical protein ACKVXR_05365 [Planctomycetota bacterium]